MMIPATRRPSLRPIGCVFALGLGLLLTARAQDAARTGGPGPDPETWLRQRLDAHRARARKLALPLLPRLRSADQEIRQLRDELTNQEIATKRAEADYENAKKTREVAEIAVKEFIQGVSEEAEEFESEFDRAKADLARARANLARARDRLEYAQKMVELGYLRRSMYLVALEGVEEAAIDEEQLKEKERVLKEFRLAKQETQLRAEVEKARADELAKQAALELERTKETRLRHRLERGTFGEAERRLLIRLDEANTLEGRARVALDDGRIDEGGGRADEAAAKLDEAEKIRDEVDEARRRAQEDAEINGLIHAAAEAIRGGK